MKLAERFPSLGDLPRLAIAELPTPVELATPWLPWLRHQRVWVKRDDLASSIYGGNKVRRFEYLFADAQRKRRTHLVTVGGLASTQVTATAYLGRAHGFGVTAVLFDQPITDFTKRALALDAAAGAELIYGGGYVSTVFKTIAAARRPGAYFIEPGAGTPLANLGYVDAVFELAAQVAAGFLPVPDYIVVPAGSCGTVAALALGCALLDWPTTVVGVRITLAIACNRFVVNQRLRGLIKLLEIDADEIQPRFSLFPYALGPGYGFPTVPAIEGAEQWASLTGVKGEVTYTGKAMAALRQLTHAEPDKTFLFWNTLSSVPLTTPSESLVPAAFQAVLQQASVSL